MNRRRKKFYGKAIVLKKQFTYMTVFICLFLVLTSNSINIITQAFKTDVYKFCLSYSLPMLDIKRAKNILNIIEKYEERLAYHKKMYEVSGLEELKNYIEKDKILIKKWKEYLQNHSKWL